MQAMSHQPEAEPPASKKPTPGKARALPGVLVIALVTPALLVDEPPLTRPEPDASGFFEPILSVGRPNARGHQ